MKFAVIALIALASVHANAASFYLVNGKQSTAGQAKKEAMKDPKAIVYKIQATRVQFNDETGNLKKSADMTADDIKKVASSLK